MIPVEAWYLQRHQQAVRELIEVLRGEACEKNAAVVRLINEAADHHVSLSVQTSLTELEAANIDFTIAKLRENCGLSNA